MLEQEFIRRPIRENFMPMETLTYMMPVVYNAAIRKQFRFPRSKKKRIRNKWKKQNRNFKPAMFLVENTLFAHPHFKPYMDQIVRDLEAKRLKTSQQAHSPA